MYLCHELQRSWFQLTGLSIFSCYKPSFFALVPQTASYPNIQGTFHSLGACNHCTCHSEFVFDSLSVHNSVKYFIQNVLPYMLSYFLLGRVFPGCSVKKINKTDFTHTLLTWCLNDENYQVKIVTTTDQYLYKNLWSKLMSLIFVESL